MKRLILFALTIANTLHATVTMHTQAVDEQTQTITFTVPVPQGSYVYKDYLHVAVDHPGVTLSEWKANTDAATHFDTAFKDNKKVFDKDFVITLQASSKDTNHDDAHLQLTYYLNTNKKITQEQFPLSFKNPEPAASTVPLATTVHALEALVQPAAPAAAAPASRSFSERISSLVQTTDSLGTRLLLVLLLGVLMSLTPCIYPMIPITAGILQSRGSASIGRNFCVALSYTMGIATTFACLGLMAAFTGQVFGAIMQNPIVILSIVAMLIYLAFSMFGFYDMYIPKSMRGGNQSVKGGSMISAFAFGVASGSMASPCLSPGLMLLLSIVTTLGSKLLGFLLLFFFGIGLSLPLLLVGTFSSSLNLLPRAGMWMLEVKSFFGFMLLGMCLYFLNALVPYQITMISCALLVAAAGCYYLATALRMQRSKTRTIKHGAGMFLIAASVALGAKAVVGHLSQTQPTQELWQHNYAAALAQAAHDNQPLFVAFSTQFCSLCKAIDASVFKKECVCTSMQGCTCVKVDDPDSCATDGTALTALYNVRGFPTYLLIDPHTGKEIKRWGGELYDMPQETFATELKTIIASCEILPPAPQPSVH